MRALAPARHSPGTKRIEFCAGPPRDAPPSFPWSSDLINSNTLFRTLAILAVLAHAGVLIGSIVTPRALSFLLGLNALTASAILLYGATRLRYLLAAMDWPYFVLLALELGVLAGALWAFKGSRPAVITSYIACGLHACASIAALVFACVFKLTKLM